MKPLLALGLMLSTLTVLTQDRPVPPKFVSGTALVLVDFVVTDKADLPVKGLSAADFVVKEDGKERPIVSFTAFSGDDPPAAAAAYPGSPPRPTPAGAATVLVIDDGQLTPEQAARLRPSIKALLANIAQRSGSVALIAPWSKVSEAMNLPGGTAELAAAVDRINGRLFQDHSTFPVSDVEAIAVESGDPITLSRLSSRFMALNSSLRLEQAVALAQSRSAEVAFDARTRRDLLFNVAMRSMDWLEGQPGRHSLLMVSGGFARDPGDVRFNQIVTRSLRVNAPIHFLDARGLQGISRFDGVEFAAALPPSAGEAPFAFSDAAGGSTGLADDTGGITIRNTNDMAKGLGRVLETMTTYYLLSYEPPAHTKPGFRKITVEARAKGLHVRARRGYVDPAVPTR